MGIEMVIMRSDGCHCDFIAITCFPKPLRNGVDKETRMLLSKNSSFFPKPLVDSAEMKQQKVRIISPKMQGELSPYESFSLPR
jgi:hypothetical protein